MKNKFLASIIFLVILLSISIFYFLNKKNNINVSSYAFSEFKKTCTLFYGPSPINIYQNKETGFGFEYPEDVIICERTSLYDNVTTSKIEITVWNKVDFLSETPKEKPLPITIDINNEHINELTSMMDILSEEEVIINNRKITKKELINKSCVTNCPIFNMYEFVNNTYHFVISEDQNSDYSIINSIKFD